MIARGFSSRTSPSEKFLTFGRQPVLRGDPLLELLVERRQIEEEVLVSRNSGVEPSMIDRGLIRSTGSSWLPQLSHWSPRASGKPQIGQVPST